MVVNGVIINREQEELTVGGTFGEKIIFFLYQKVYGVNFLLLAGFKWIDTLFGTRMLRHAFFAN